MKQASFFDQRDDVCREEKFDLPNADVRLIHHWLQVGEAQALFGKLRDQLQWEQTEIWLHGKQHPIPRLNAWYGDEGQRYTYSGRTFHPLPWTPTLYALKERIERHTGYGFNSVLANLYRDGADSVAWHADDEPELGRNPVIASLSLGGTRRFSLKPRHPKSVRPLHIDLVAGSLLLMASSTQHHWLHQIPKTVKPVEPRINLTFRLVKHGVKH